VHAGRSGEGEFRSAPVALSLWEVYREVFDHASGVNRV
jgi:hypothetical protein